MRFVTNWIDAATSCEMVAWKLMVFQFTFPWIGVDIWRLVVCMIFFMHACFPWIRVNPKYSVNIIHRFG